MRHLGKTPLFRGPNGQTLPGSIAEIGYVRLGGLDQWVMIRGESVANPALFLLHGGPGFPEMRLFRHFNAPLEKTLTVVYWEQRGTDKSFDRKIPISSMTVEQFIGDLDELVDAVRERRGKNKVAIYGHSWGSVLGVLYAARFPEKVAAYVGTGQIGDWPASELSCYEFVLHEAEHRKNRRAVKQLRAMGAPPHAIKKLYAQRKWLVRSVGVPVQQGASARLRCRRRRPMTKRQDRDSIYVKRQFDTEIIVLCVRWYITYRLSYRDLVAMMAERGVIMSHTTIMRWVIRYVPEFEKRWNRFARSIGSSWHVDETYVSIKGRWHYLYRAVDKQGRSIDFMLRPDRGIAAAQAFVRRALASHPDRAPRKVTLDGHVPSHRALRLLRREHPAWRRVRVRSSKYLNNIIEQDHRAIKRRCASMKGFKSFANAAVAIAGVELAHRIHKH